MNRDAIVRLLEMLNVPNITPGDEWVNSSCPFAPYTTRHRSDVDRRPSFGISVGKKSFYKCFTCTKQGAPLPLLPSTLMMMTGKDNVALRKFISDGEEFSLEPYEQVGRDREPLAVLSESILKKYPKLMGEYKKFASTRRLNDEGIKQFGIRADISSLRIIFPVRNKEGQLVGVTGRAIKGGTSMKYRAYTELNPHRQDPKSYGVWFGMQFVPAKGQKLILVEGQIDAVTLWQALKRPVWSSMGSGISRDQIKALQALGNPLVLFMDDDEAGQDAHDLIIKRLRNEVPISYVTNYGGCEDPAEVYKRGKLRQALRSIKSLTNG